MIPPSKVAIFVFEEVEVLDFAGSFEVFNVTAELNDPAQFNVYTVTETTAPIKVHSKIRIHPTIFTLILRSAAFVSSVFNDGDARVLSETSHGIACFGLIKCAIVEKFQ